MRIAVVGPTYPFRGGIAHHTTLLVQALREAGHEVLFISFTRQYPAWLYGRDDKDPSQHPLTTDVEYLIDSVNPWTWRSAGRRLRRFRPDLLVLPWWVPYWAFLWRYLSWVVKRGGRQTDITVICHNVLPHESGWFDLLMLKIGIGGGDRFVVHAQKEKDRLANIWATAQIILTPISTFGEVGQVQTELPIELPTDRPILLFCGLIRPYKGLDILLEALALIVPNIGVHLAVVGEFWQDEAVYQTQIDRLGIRPYLSIVNRYVENEVLSAFLHRADVVVLPYRSATQSAVAQLAFGHGVPVITTAVGGLVDLESDIYLDNTIVPNDPDALALGILKFCEQMRSGELEQTDSMASSDYSWATYVRLVIPLL